MDEIAPVQEVDPLESLAADYVRRRLDGEPVQLEAYLERLQHDADRTRLVDLVADAVAVDALLPRRIREGSIVADRYRITGELGAGGMGRVFSALDLQLKRRVAVKVLSAVHGSVDMAALFARESELLAALQHPGIVALHEAGRDGDVQYIVMDLVEGVSVETLIERLRGVALEGRDRTAAALRAALGLPFPAGGRPLEETDYWRAVAGLTAELARTLEAAHARGVLHRDLKPGNVMVRGDGSPVVLDFGLGGRLDCEVGEVSRGLYGTACYLAPEQVRRGAVGRDPRTDVYQIGLILYELLTLHRAFPGDDLSSVLRRVGAGSFAAPRRVEPAVPRDLDAICLRALELCPARRYPSARMLREDLEAFVSRERRPRAAAGILLRDGRYVLRRRRRASQIAAALLLGAAAVLPFVREPGDTTLSVFTYDPVIAQRVDDPDHVAPRQEIGVTVRTAGAKYFYAYSLFGPTNAPRAQVAALRPRAVSETGGDAGPYAVALEPGTHHIRCALVADPVVGSEGVVVFLLDERCEPLERWLAWLGPKPVAFEQARSLVKELERPTRGASVPDTLAARDRAALRRAVEESPHAVPFAHLEPRIFRLPVRA